MINAGFIIYLLFAHWVADFVFQTDWQAKNKSKQWKALLSHTTVYTIVLAIFMIAYDPLIALLNGVIHTLVDYFTSRASSKLWVKGEVHNFFAVVGFDQWIHAATLIATYTCL